jgi:phosphatidate cytidylyltransferase
MFCCSIFQSGVWIAYPHEASLAVKSLVLLSSVGWCSLVLVTVIKGDVTVPAQSIRWSLFGIFALAAAWCCLAVLFLQRGAFFLFSLLVVVWIADVAAYFGGKAFGRRKLAIRISPGKTREGALFGILGVLLWIVVSAQWPQTFAAQLVRIWGLGPTILFAIALATISIVGDLFESLLKRRAAVKDSSNLLPGHGGVLDRIDAVIAVVPIAFMLTEFR